MRVLKAAAEAPFQPAKLCYSILLFSAGCALRADHAPTDQSAGHTRCARQDRGRAYPLPFQNSSTRYVCGQDVVNWVCKISRRAKELDAAVLSSSVSWLCNLSRQNQLLSTTCSRANDHPLVSAALCVTILSPGRWPRLYFDSHSTENASHLSPRARNSAGQDIHLRSIIACTTIPDTTQTLRYTLRPTSRSCDLASLHFWFVFILVFVFSNRFWFVGGCRLPGELELLQQSGEGSGCGLVDLA